MLVVTTKKKQADEYTQETTKLTKKNRTGKHKWKHAACDHVRKKGKKILGSRFIQEYENKNILQT
jgi:hypothetical protein